MVQVKVKKFSRSIVPSGTYTPTAKTEIQPEVLPVNEENEEIKETEEDVNKAPILPINELDDLTNINFNKKSEAEEILKKVISKKKETQI